MVDWKDEVRVCNCAECNKPLYTYPDGKTDVAGRIKGRPYCRRCLGEPEEPKVHGGIP